MTQAVHLPNDEQAFDALCEKISLDLSEKSYALVDGFLSLPQVEAVLDELNRYFREGDFKDAGIGAAHQFQVQKEIRKDKIRWIDPNAAGDASRTFVQKLRYLMQFINRTCYLGLKDFEMHYTVYPKGAFYKRHLDQFKVSDHRRLTFLCYLNKDWAVSDGGLLRLYLKNHDGQEIPFDISPLAGRFLCFRSDLLEHEVLVCHRERFSLTGWMLDQLNELTFL